jgi:signal transduction histidine kinase
MEARAQAERSETGWFLRLAAIISVAVAAVEVLIDWTSWVELNVSIVYGLPLVLAALSLKRRLLWSLLAILIVMIFAVYAVQISPGQFSLHEPLFINRLLAAFALIITACLLEVLMAATGKVAAQDEALTERNLDLEEANQELVRRAELITRQNQELEFRRRQAEEASVRKTQIMAAVSHDIRAPVNAISLMAEIMCRTAENPTLAAELPDVARRLKANALSLVDLISDVLDMARLDAPGELHSTCFSLHDLLLEQCQGLLPLAHAKGLTLECQAPELLIRLRTDRVKLSRIISNLLTNAIKFTARGGVTARIAIDSGGTVAVEIADTGIGIPPDSLELIFDEYAQLNNPEGDRYKGWGLGLPICKRLIGMLGGAISVVSQSNRGTTFTVRLPVDCLCEEEQELPGGPRFAHDLSG